MGFETKRWAVWITTILILAIVASYAWTHRNHLLAQLAGEHAAPEPDAAYAEEQEAQKMVVVAGPMADYVLRQKAGNVVTLQPAAQPPSAADHVGDSPVGTSREILNKTFRVNGIVDLPFEIPAHAATPTLKGTYRSFVKESPTGSQSAAPARASVSSDAVADVDFLVLNEQQFGDFLNGRPGDAIFSADSAHDGEVNFSLPPTLAKSTWYYLVFRNGSPGGDKKIVQADFRVDF